MKNSIFLLLLVFNTSIFGQIMQDCNGKVGIGVTPNPSYNLTVNGYNYLSGYVGIGTTPTSSYRLYVNGNGYFSGTNYFTGYSYFSSPINLSFSNTSPAFTITANTGAAPGLLINGSANYLLCVNGNTYCTLGYWSGSDSRLKKNIQNIPSDNLSKLGKLNGYIYQYNKDSVIKRKSFTANLNDSLQTEILNNDKLFEKKRIGLLADQVKSVYPELTDELDDGTLAIDYNGMVALLVEAINELNHKNDSIASVKDKSIESLIKRIEQLEFQLSDCCSYNKNKSFTKDSIVKISIQQPILYQNNPNPFSITTQINYYLPERTQNANICIYDMNGTQLKSIKLHQKGNGSIIVNGKELNAGMYLYCLIADGQMIDTKRMVLTD